MFHVKHLKGSDSMDKRSKFFWIYATVLFSVVFVLVLVSAFTLNRSNSEKEAQNTLYQGAKQSLEDLTKEKERLEQSERDLKAEILKLQEESQKKDSEIETLKNTIDSYDSMVEAYRLYYWKKHSEAKKSFERIDVSLLKEEGKTFYNSLRSKIY